MPLAERAAAHERLVAFAWDYLIMLGYIASLAASAALVRSIVGDAARPFRPWQADLLAFVVLVLPVILYFALSEASGFAATWGKRRVGLRVADLNGNPPTVVRSLLRSALKFLPWQIAHTSLFSIPGWPLSPPDALPASTIAGFGIAFSLAGAYFVGLLLTPDRRTLYDLIAGTKVIRVR